MEFLPDLVELLRLDLLGAVLLAILLGGAVGLERELHGKPAGLRTNILICVGATLFTQLSMYVAGDNGDPGRIAAQIVTGVGFIGAGTILHARGSVTGLTTAATIWVVAAIGVAVGAGAIFEAAGVTLLMILVLSGLRRLETYVQARSEVSHVSVEARDEDDVERIERAVRQAGLEVDEIRTEQIEGRGIVVHVAMRGPHRLHDEARLALLRASGAYKVSLTE